MTSLEDNAEVRKKIKEKGEDEAWARLVYLFYDEDRQCQYYVCPEARLTCSDPDYSFLGNTLDEAVDQLIAKLTDIRINGYINKKL